MKSPATDLPQVRIGTPADIIRDLAHTFREFMVDWRRLTHVFAYKGKPVARMLTSSWRRVRKNLGLRQVRVHDLKHTFGWRLRAAGVSFEDRQANKLPFQSNPFAQKFELIPLGAD